MNSDDKIAHMLREIRERARISPKGPFYIDIATVIDIEANGGIPDEAPILFSKIDQITILKKFESDGLIYIVNFDDNYKGAMVALVDLDISTNDNPYKKMADEVTDLSKGILCINKIPVSISDKVGKENNPLRLLKTLMKNPEIDWFKDQILEDWEGANYEMSKVRFSKNIVYAAARNLNTKILEKTSIGDFVLYDTHKFKINPKYLDSF